MIKNYFKTAWRILWKNKGYSAINIFGLAIGMAVALIIGLWVYHQYSYDRFLPDTDRLYRVQRNYDSNGDTLTFLTTSLKLADAIRKDIPEIEYVAESDWMGGHGLVVGDKKIAANGGIIAGDFLKMFQFPFVSGNANTSLSEPYSIILTESLAKALFGEENAMGKMVRFDNKDNLKVSGILKDVPKNSTIQFKFIVPFAYLELTNPNVKARRSGSFGNNANQIFVKLKPGVRYSQVAGKLRLITHSETNNLNAMNSYVTLQPMQRWHLYSNYINGQDTEGFLTYVRIFSIIGILVLIIACINFINLTTARSEQRAREVGVRKAIGSLRSNLIFQFLAESFLLTLFSSALAILLVQLTLPAFNALTAGSVVIPYSNPVFWTLMTGGIIITTLLAGSRPAFYLSSFQPVKVLKASRQGGRAASIPRKVLVVLQFSCSIALIISTIIIYNQVQYAKNRPVGLDVNRLMATYTNIDLEKNYTALKNELLSSGIASSVTQASSPATDVYWHTDIDHWPGKNAGETIEMGNLWVGTDYLKTLGMQLAEGRTFTSENDTTSVMFNESAIKRMRMTNPINQVIRYGDRDYTIVGIVKDALMISPFLPAEPAMFHCSNDIQDVIMYRLSPQISTHDAIAKLTGIFNKYSPAFPYEYQFADEQYNAKFNLEVLIGKLSGIFAALAILISCLGLFGLAAYIAEQRTKEIGIRKVLGASIAQVWLLLSRDFIMLVILSCVIASPIAYYFLNNWLSTYQYRIGIGPAVFVIAAIVALLITVLTVSFQAIRAATANPVESLRAE